MRTQDRLERDLIRLAHTLPYPTTPPIAGRVVERLRTAASGRTRRVNGKWGAVAVLILLALLMLVPPARAAVVEIIQIGVVRILRFPNPPSPATAVPVPSSQLLPEAPRTATPAPTPIPILALPDLAGETTLPAAQAKLDFPILLPAYPRDLNDPDRVFLQTMGSPMLVLVWLDPDHPGVARLSLDEIAPGNWSITKYNPPVIEQVTINGQPAIWTEGPYILQASNGNYVVQRMVEGRVLIWTQGQITYRLETALSLEEAVKIAESLAPAAIPTPSKAAP